MDNQNLEPRNPGEELKEQLSKAESAETPESLYGEEVTSEEPVADMLTQKIPDVEVPLQQTAAAEAASDMMQTQKLPDTETALQKEAAQESDWLDDILGEQKLGRELEADEQAVAEAGLVHPEDAELENILREEREKQEGAADATQMFTPVDINDIREEEDDAEEEEEDEEETPQRKRRPRMKKGYGLFGIPHILATGVWLAIILAIGLYLGRIVWLCAEDVLALGKTPEKVTVVITEEDDIVSISKKLQLAGMVRYPKLFQQFAELTEKGEEIEPGTYTFNQKLGVDEKFKGIAYDYNALILAMQHYGGAQDTVEVLFPEGYNCAQIFALLEEKGVCTVQELEEYAAGGALDEYWFLENVERGHRYSLEGYLCADTYQFYIDDEPKRVLEKFLDEFDDRYTERLQQKFTELNQMLANKMAANGYSEEFITGHQLTLHDVVVLASIVEKETASNVESFDIAQVYYNRLADPDNYPYLNSKATMKYAEEYYYKDQLHTTSAKEECEFNTDTHPGLPEKPICNPSLNSMAAALGPTTEGGYFYFVYDEDASSHRFASTQSGYNAILKELGLDDE